MAHNQLATIKKLEEFHLQYQYENDPKYTSKTSEERLQKRKIRALERFSQKADLDPTQNLKNDLKRPVLRRSA